MHVDQSMAVDNNILQQRASHPEAVKTPHVTIGPGLTTLVDMTLYERLKKVLEDNNWNPGVWAKRADLHRSHVYGLMKQAQEKPSQKLAYETARKLAKAAGVSVEWLMEDRGSPDDAYLAGSSEEDEEEEPARLPGKARAAEAARALQYPAEAIQEVLDSEDDEVDLGAEYYLQQMQAAAARIRKRRPPPPSKTNLPRP
jgi:hypothetical protein